MHPLSGKNYDIYNEFRKCWEKFPFKSEVMQQISAAEKQAITELCTQVTVNNKVRRIYRINKNI